MQKNEMWFFKSKKCIKNKLCIVPKWEIEEMHETFLNLNKQHNYKLDVEKWLTMAMQ